MVLLEASGNPDEVSSGQKHMEYKGVILCQVWGSAETVGGGGQWMRDWECLSQRHRLNLENRTQIGAAQARPPSGQ